MRLKLLSVAILLAALAFLAGSPGAFSQQGGGRKGKGGGGFPGGGIPGFPPGGGMPPGGFQGGGFGGFQGGKGMMGGGMMDPNAMFEYLAKGRDHFLISETTRSRESMMEFARSKGLKDEKMTRELYTGYTEYMRVKQGGAPGAPGTPGVGIAPPGNPADYYNQMAAEEFRRKDENGDSFLNRDEMPGNLRDELPKWDRNQDNLVDFNEFKAYFLSRVQERMERDGQRAAAGNAIIIDDDWEKRPVVFRAGKLPQGLPKWFTELDRDEDGQVSLAEWRRAGKDMDTFGGYDRNDDGLMTPAEALRVEMVAKNNGKGRPAATSDGSVANVYEIRSQGQGKKKGDWGAKMQEWMEKKGKKKGGG